MDEFAIVDVAAILKGIEVIIGVVIKCNTEVAELVAFCIAVLVIEEVELTYITLLMLTATGARVVLVVL